MNNYIVPYTDASRSLGWVINKLEGASFEVKNIDVPRIHYFATIYRWYLNWVSNEKNALKKCGERWNLVWAFFFTYSVITSRYVFSGSE